MSVQRSLRISSLLLASMLASFAPRASALGIGTPFCFGDGSSGPCPCGNTGMTGQGCDNSFATGGALLVATGTADLFNNQDSVTLVASSAVPNNLGVFLQTDLLLSGPVFFGDGLRCGGGNTIRFGVKVADPFGTSVFPTGAECAVHLAVQVPCHAAPGEVSMGPGVTRYYNYWYRNPATFCTIYPHNVSNAVPITW